MWNGKKKAITFSYDDGISQDIRLVELLNKYGLKGTFNLNSELLGKPGRLIRNGVEVRHDKIAPEKIAEVYRGHEVAAHTLTHPFLPRTPDEEVIRQVEQDRKNLSALCGYNVVGMAYPGGSPGGNHDERVEKLIRENTGIKYARGVETNASFALQSDLIAFVPTVFHLDEEKMFSLANKFLEMDPEEPALFYIWGHSYEFDAWNYWERFEEFCKLVSGKDDIFYCTNREAFGF